ncbi:septum formation family protein [Demequina sp. NBRC 110053]|uniref:septum formation family protein n=1 Tax=Demequina sp. NBRC 110053 TaxID=1570342 RepID=UPI000A03CBE1|nr:septum formation family protein [Demequina sp. NBRC 110053]
MSDQFAPPGGFTAPDGPDRRSDAAASAAPAGDTSVADHSAPRRQRPPGATTTARKAGPAMAIAAWTGIAAGVALLIGISWSVALDWQGTSLEPAEPGATGDLPATSLVPGMCLETVGDDGSVGKASVVDCEQPHEGEVISEIDFAEARFPGDQAIAERSLGACATRMDGVGPDGSSWVAWVPTEDSWHRDDKRALCILVLDEAVEGRVGPDATGEVDDEPVSGQET